MNLSRPKFQRLFDSNAPIAFAQAHWIWVDPSAHPENGTLRFSCDFAWSGGPLVFHVSADQRFQLFLDGDFLAAGPATGARECWFFSSYKLELPAGPHRFSALVWCLPKHGPYAHMSVRPGFLFASDQGSPALLTTGLAPWKASSCPEIEPHPERKLPGAHFIGPCYDIDRRRLVSARQLPIQPIGPGFAPVVNGRLSPQWQLANNLLPEVLYQPWTRWKPRAATAHWLKQDEQIESAWTTPAALLQAALLAKGEPVTVDAHSSWSFLFDAETILSAYSGLETEGGLDADIELLWCESLGHGSELLNNNFMIAKGNRDEVVGKRCFGEGDHFLPGPQEGRTQWTTLWWRAGRYLLVRIRTGDAPLTIHRLACNETRYPLPPAPQSRTSDSSLLSVLQLCENGFRVSCHDIYADCPAFEQLMYAGDARVQILIHRAIESDDRLARKAIHLFNLSRHYGQGWTLSRFPSRVGQIIPGYSLIWVLMVDDFLHWHEDLEFVRDQVPGVRATLDLFETHLGADGWLKELPGWGFVDWCEGWDNGVPPRDCEGRSLPINLFYLLAMQAAVRIERACGQPARAALLETSISPAQRTLRSATWDASSGLFRDAPGVDRFSEQTQALAVLALGLPREEQSRLLRSMRDHTGRLAKCSYYFAHYLFEACRSASDDSCHSRLDDWKALLKWGLRTPAESFEPTRSDCHGWGAHPLFHLPATFLGLRPAAPRMERVVIAPLPGPLKTLQTAFPWRDAFIQAELHFAGKRLSGNITLPEPLTGELRWEGTITPLRGGQNRIDQ